MAWKNVQYQNGKYRTSNGGGGGGSGHDYSTTEQVVGTWIDGKPIYELVVEFTTTVYFSTSWINLGTGIVPVNGVAIDGRIIDTSNQCHPCGVSVASNLYIYIPSSGISNFSSRVIQYLIIQYTKTTD